MDDVQHHLCSSRVKISNLVFHTFIHAFGRRYHKSSRKNVKHRTRFSSCRVPQRKDTEDVHGRHNQ